MINNLGKYLINFLVIVFIQVLILNNLNLGGYINPWLYLLFILILPVEIPDWMLLLIGFLTGLLMDMFLNTIGMHASATVFLAFIRPFLLRFFAPRDGYEPGSLPIPSHFGVGWFLKYVSLTVVAHHIFLFYVEVFNFDTPLLTLWKAIVSSVFTIAFIMVAQMFGAMKSSRS
ncbi:rod shape-determining protein MreD [Alkalitalea saponilacus]|uniref:Rod shape-determining protein MreD n=1 Tax=Alkalitalea saponilacus TaxID=889453 RepID=A0A1T5A554_9BACT|nr:rod shape-determining protein MreD [Alkalitalea saponilacus]ASB48847.1 rod shape-determining protein MreD [Alkalitalea saponilacus]SKB30035.1 rod shape-determining protein MreD [Alkalitalea saponilacus]